MSSNGEGSRPRLDPFAFPSDTTVRFVLLVVAVAGTSLFAFHSAAVSRSSDRIRSVSQCLAAGGSSSACGSDGLHRSLAASILAAFAVLVLATVVVYLALPLWKVRRRRLEPLSASDAPDVVARLGELSREAGLGAAPRFVWNPLDRSVSGLAFGRAGRRQVALGGGLVILAYTDPDAFRAIVLHELGHIRNRDVDKTYVTMALWYAFLAIAVLPLLVSLRNATARYSLSIGWRLGVLAGLVYLARNAVLRARESYADLRAARSAGAAGALRRVIAALPVPHQARWRRLLGVHPDPPARLALLDDADPLFRPGPGEAFGAGVALTLAYGQLLLLTWYLGVPYIDTYLVAALVAAPWCAAVVVLGAWRGAFLRLVRPAASVGLSWLGVALGLGFLAGESLSLLTLETHAGTAFAQAPLQPHVEGVVGAALLGPGILWAALAVACLMLFVRWTDAAATAWLSRGGERLPRVAIAAAVVTAGALLSAWTALFFFLHDVTAPAEQVELVGEKEFYALIGGAIWAGPSALVRFVWDPRGSVVTGFWFVFPALVLVWAFPLAAAARRRATAWPSWAFLGGSRPPALRAQRLRVGRAGLVGLAAGLAAWSAMLVLAAWAHASGRPLSDALRLGVYHWEYVLGLAAQVLAAAVAVLVCPRSAVLHGLLAAFVAGLVAVVAIELDVTVRSCATPFSISTSGTSGCPRLADLGIARDDLDLVLARGTPLALATALVTVGIVWLVRRAPSASA
jgi:Zn-dependent protease with chaperone function